MAMSSDIHLCRTHWYVYIYRCKQYNSYFLLKQEYVTILTIIINTFVQCHRSLSLSQFFATVPQATPPVLGLLGCGCSVASEPVAEIIHHWNISQVIKPN